MQLSIGLFNCWWIYIYIYLGYKHKPFGHYKRQLCGGLKPSISGCYNVQIMDSIRMFQFLDVLNLQKWYAKIVEVKTSRN